MSTLRTSNLIHGSSSINNIVLDTQGRAIFGPNSAQGRASLYVNPQNNRVGINNESPAVALDVDGAINATGNVSFTGDLNIDSGTLFVDSSNNRVGIGTSSPSTKLHIASTAAGGDVHITNASGQNCLLEIAGNGNTIGSGSALYGQDASNNVYAGWARGAHPVLFGTNGQERMRIDSSGDVTIQSSTPLLTLKDTDNAADSSVVSEVQGRDSASTVFWRLGHLSTGNQSLYLYNQRSDALLLGTAGTERMRIDSSGRLLLNTTSVTTYFSATAQAYITDLGGTRIPLALETYRNDASGAYLVLSHSRGLAAGNYTTLINDDELGRISFNGSDGSALGNTAANISARVDGVPSTNNLPGKLIFATSSFGANVPTERMRITNAGKVGIGTDGSQSAERLQVRTSNDVQNQGYAIATQSSTTNTNFHMRFINPNGSVGSITTAAVATAFNTSSDYRLKENVVEITDGITRVKQLAPKRFNFIVDDTKTFDGFLAHEAQTVVPEAVTGEKDATREEQYEVRAAVLNDEGEEVIPAVMGTRTVPDHQGIDQSKLVPLLTAALQEAIAKIETLEQRLTDAGL